MSWQATSPRPFAFGVVVGALLIFLATGASAQARPWHVTTAQARTEARRLLERGEWEAALDAYEAAAKHGLQTPFDCTNEHAAMAMLREDAFDLLEDYRADWDLAGEQTLLTGWLRHFPFFPAELDSIDSARRTPDLREIEERLVEVGLRLQPRQLEFADAQFCRELRALDDARDWREVLRHVHEQMPQGHPERDGGRCRLVYARAVGASIEDAPRSPAVPHTSFLLHCEEMLRQVESRFGLVPAWLMARWDECLGRDLPACSLRPFLELRRSVSGREASSELNPNLLESLPRRSWQRYTLLVLGSRRLVEDAGWLPEEPSPASVAELVRSSFEPLLTRFPESREASYARYFAARVLGDTRDRFVAMEYVRDWERDRPGDDYLDEALFHLSGARRGSGQFPSDLDPTGRTLLHQLLKRYPGRATTPLALVALACPALKTRFSPETVAQLEQAAKFEHREVLHPSVRAPDKGPGAACFYLAPHYRSLGQWNPYIHALQNSQEQRRSFCGNAYGEWRHERKLEIARCLESVGRLDEAWAAWMELSFRYDGFRSVFPYLDHFVELCVTHRCVERVHELLREIARREEAARRRNSHCDFSRHRTAIGEWLALLRLHDTGRVADLWIEYEKALESHSERPGGWEERTYRIRYGPRASNVLMLLASLLGGVDEIQAQFAREVTVATTLAAGATLDAEVTEKLIDLHLAEPSAAPLREASLYALRRQELPALRALGRRLCLLGSASWDRLKGVIGCFPIPMQNAAWKELARSDDPRVRSGAEFLLARAGEQESLGMESEGR